LLFIMSFTQFINSQIPSDLINVEKEDTNLLELFLPDLEVNASNAEYLKKWNRTKFYVKSVYDYSRIASAMLVAFEDTLSTIQRNRAQNKYLKKANKLLKKEFGDEIKQMSITRGTYLMKLIYRNTDLTAYDIIKKYRGGGSAFWFQALCLVSGQDLKRTYHPEEDLLIEKAVRMIESGKMTYYKRVALTKAAKDALKKKQKKKRKRKKK